MIPPFIQNLSAKCHSVTCPCPFLTDQQKTRAWGILLNILKIVSCCTRLSEACWNTDPSYVTPVDETLSLRCDCTLFPLRNFNKLLITALKEVMKMLDSKPKSVQMSVRNCKDFPIGLKGYYNAQKTYDRSKNNIFVRIPSNEIALICMRLNAICK